MRLASLLLLLLLLALGQAVDAHPPGGSLKSQWPQVHSIRLLQGKPAYTITSSITKLTANGQVTDVTIAATQPARRGSAAERAGHLLALYPSPSDARTMVPITFVNVTKASPGYPSSGRAVVRMKLLAARVPGLLLRLISNHTVWPVVEGESGEITNAAADAPGQLHVAQHADGASLVVQWTSASAAPQQLVYYTEASSSSSSVEAGSTSTSSSKGKPHGKVVASSSRTYSAGMMCGPPASSFGFMTPGYLHAAIIPGRDVGHDTTLHYRAGSASVGWASGHVTSSPAPADVAAGRRSFTFLVFNDVGQENAVLFDDICPPYCPGGWAWEPYTANSTKLLAHLLAEDNARLGLLVGDLSYANGFQADWDYFMYQFAPAFSKWPLAVAPGNHERSKDAGGECNVPYTYRYYTPAWRASERQPSSSMATPGNAPAAATTSASVVPSYRKPGKPSQPPAPPTLPQWLDSDRSWYSFDMAGVHFLMLDTEVASDPGSPQGHFVAADLAQVDRRATPWVVVGLHRQMVGPTTNVDNVAALARLQADYEDLFMQHKVDLVLQGHDHAYARTCPVYKGTCVTPPQQAASSAAAGDGGTATASRHRHSTGQGSGVVQTVRNPGAPIYILAGHAGAGFTHAFPKTLPEWVAYGVQDRNGYVRVTVQGGRLVAVSISTDDGHVMDGVEILRD